MLALLRGRSALRSFVSAPKLSPSKLPVTAAVCRRSFRFGKWALVSRCRQVAPFVALRNSIRGIGFRALAKQTASSAAAAKSKKNISLRTYLWRCVWVPYFILAFIPHSFLVLTLYYLLKGNRAKARGWAFYMVTGYACLPLSFVVNVSAPFVYAFDWDRRLLYNYITKLWGKITTYPFIVPEIVGLDRLPPSRDSEEQRPVIFVSNHQSWLDIFCLCWLPDEVILRFVSKKEIAYIPVVGWSMALLGHVLFDRATGGKQLLADCSSLLRKGIPVFFFPEGTRSEDCSQILPFKAGAFKLALNAKATIVPVTVVGTGDIMQIGHETELHLGKDKTVRIVIHDPIEISEEDTVETLRDKSAASILSALAEPP